LELEDYLPSPRTRTVLKLTAIGGFTAIARILLKSGADVNVQTPPAGYDKVTTGKPLCGELSTALCDAIAHNQKSIAGLLIEWEADVELGERTPLEVAIVQQNIPLVRLLRRNGAKAVEVEVLDRVILRAGWLASGTIEELDAEIRALDVPRSALVRAMKLRLDFPVACLLEAGADINSRSVNGDFLLCAAASWGHDDFVEFLIENGAEEMWRLKVASV